MNSPCTCTWFQITSPVLVHQILRCKQENPALFGWEIRDLLIAHQICDEATCPSVSSINRILRHTADGTQPQTTPLPWPATWHHMNALAAHPYRSYAHHHHLLRHHAANTSHPTLNPAATNQLPDILVSHNNLQSHFHRHLQNIDSESSRGSLLTNYRSEFNSPPDKLHSVRQPLHVTVSSSESNAADQHSLRSPSTQRQLNMSPKLVKQELIRPNDADHVQQINANDHKQFTSFTIDRILQGDASSKQLNWAIQCCGNNYIFNV